MTYCMGERGWGESDRMGVSVDDEKTRLRRTTFNDITHDVTKVGVDGRLDQPCHDGDRIEGAFGKVSGQTKKKAFPCPRQNPRS